MSTQGTQGMTGLCAFVFALLASSKCWVQKRPSPEFPREQGWANQTQQLQNPSSLHLLHSCLSATNTPEAGVSNARGRVIVAQDIQPLELTSL